MFVIVSTVILATTVDYLRESVYDISSKSIEKSGKLKVQIEHFLWCFISFTKKKSQPHSIVFYILSHSGLMHLQF